MRSIFLNVRRVGERAAGLRLADPTNRQDRRGGFAATFLPILPLIAPGRPVGFADGCA
jgi:hypothetical protein